MSVTYAGSMATKNVKVEGREEEEIVGQDVTKNTTPHDGST